MAEQLGAAYVSVTLDSAEFEARVDRAKGKLSELGPAAQQAFQTSTTTGKSATLSFQRYVDTVDMGKDQIRQFNAAVRAGGNTAALDALAVKLRGIRDEMAKAAEKARETAKGDAIIESLRAQSEAIGKTKVDLLELQAIKAGRGAQAAPFIAALRAEEAQLKNTTRAVNEYGLSAKQQTAAMRQVPAQITDIFTSLQGGQNPLTVLIQQGGQLKDVFGGVRPAASALGGALAKLATPMMGLAVGVGAAIFGFAKFESQQEGLARALILTNQTATLSVSKLREMAAELDNVKGISANAAAEGLRLAASSGLIAVNQLSLVAEAAISTQKATGKAVKDTIEEYVGLARDPVSAVLKLNESEKFLTATIFDKIVALQQSGDVEGAAALASATRAEDQIRKNAEVVAAMGLLAGAWYNIKEKIGEAGDGALGFFELLDKRAKISAQNIRAVMSASSFGEMWKAATTPIAGPNEAFNAALENFGKGVPQKYAQLTSAELALRQSIIDGNKTREQRQKLEEAQIIRVERLTKATKAQIDANPLIQASRAAFNASSPKAPKGPSGRSERSADLRADLQDFKDAAAEERAEIANGTRLLQAQYAARTVSTGDYYNRMRAFAAQEAASQTTSIQQQITALRSRNVTGVEAINIGRQIGTLESQLAQVRSKLAVDTELLTIAEKTYNQERTASIAAYQASVDATVAAVEASYDAQLKKITASEREAEKDQKLVDIKSRLIAKLRELAIEYERGGKQDKAQYDEKVRIAEDGAKREADAVEAGEKRKMEANAQWMNGVRTGLANWMDSARNVAQQTAALTTRLLDSTVDLLTTYATTGKLAWREMIVDMGKQIVAFMMKQAVLKFLEAFGVGSKTGDSKGGGSIWQTIGSAILSGFTKNATGNVYQSPSLSAYSNTVHNTPKPFAFAKGAGVFGEAGWEAIMPLTRGPDGNLGVRTGGGGGGGGGVNLSMQFVINSDGSTSRSTSGDTASEVRKMGTEIGTMVEARLQRHMMPGGMLWKAGVTA